MIVVDNSVIVPNFVQTRETSVAKAALARDRIWLAPPLWKYEFTNVLWKMRRAGQIDEWTARDALSAAHLRMSAREIAVDQNDVLRLAVGMNISAYDAQYIAVAEKYGVVCVTNDVPLARKAHRFAILTKQFAS